MHITIDYGTKPLSDWRNYNHVISCSHVRLTWLLMGQSSFANDLKTNAKQLMGDTNVVAGESRHSDKSQQATYDQHKRCPARRWHHHSGDPPTMLLQPSHGSGRKTNEVASTIWHGWRQTKCEAGDVSRRHERRWRSNARDVVVNGHLLQLLSAARRFHYCVL